LKALADDDRSGALVGSRQDGFFYLLVVTSQQIQKKGFFSVKELQFNICMGPILVKRSLA